MAKNTKQIALIQHRRGKLSELPKQLNEGEFGIALDTNEVFIGNPENPALAERIAKDEFPWGNIQILTEYTDNLRKITYRYISNTDVKAKLPIVITGTVSNPHVYPDTSIIINGTEIVFDSAYALSSIITHINSYNLPVKAFTYDNVNISFISTDTNITLENGEVDSSDIGVLQRLGFGEDDLYTEVASLPYQRTLQSVLDDTVSVKSFDAMGNGIQNDGEAIFNAIIALNKAGNGAEYYRTLFFPAGIYNISRALPLPTGVHLKGEGFGRTIIKSQGFTKAILLTMDSNMNTSAMNEYGINADLPENILVEDMTFDVSENITSSLMALGTCKNVTFRNVEFKGHVNTLLAKLANHDVDANSAYITFENCIFNTGYIGFNAVSNLEYLVIKNCIFNNITNQSIYLNPTADNTIYNSIIDGNYFKDCGATASYPIIQLNEGTRYISTINNKFDDEETLFEVAKPYVSLSSLNYTDILDPNTDTKKLLQFNFTQPQWAYIDYLMSPNGEYIVKTEYDYTQINNEDVALPLTSNIVITPANDSNDNTTLIKTNTIDGNINYSAGKYGNVVLGENTEAEAYPEWVANTPYGPGDRVQVTLSSGTKALYECIAATSSEHNPTTDDTHQFWTPLGDYYPEIMVRRELDLNNNSITDRGGDNITFKTFENNYLTINDDYKTSDFSYAERIARYKNAIPNVDYVNTIAQTTIRNVYDYNGLENIGTNKQEIFYFDPNIYGDYIYFNYLNINVRRPFYSVLGSISNALPWRPELTYYPGDVVVSYIDDRTSSYFELYLSNGTTWSNITSDARILDSTEYDPETMTPYSSVLDDGKYGIVMDTTEGVDTESKWVWYNDNGSLVHIGSEEWKDEFTSYADSRPGAVYMNGSVFGIAIEDTTGEEPVTYEYRITLDIDFESQDSILTQAAAKINAIVGDKGVTASVITGIDTDEILRIRQTKGLIQAWDITESPLSDMGFKMDQGNLIPETVQLVKTFDVSSIPNVGDYIPGSYWLKAQGIEQDYICTMTHKSSSSFNLDLGDDGSTPKWAKVETRDAEDEPLKDIKYVSILAQHNDTIDDGGLHENDQRLLFLPTTIDVSKRDIHSQYYPNFTIGNSYSVGDRVLFDGRYWECCRSMTASSYYDLHNPDEWFAIPEEGFNYHFDFERNIYALDSEGNIVTSSDIITQYNFADYHLFLMMYDADGEPIKTYKDGDFDQLMISPSGYLMTTINYIRGL